MGEKEEKTMSEESSSSGGGAGIKIQGILSPEIYAKFKELIEYERKKAKENLRPEPSESSILAMLVARGIISYWADEQS